MNTVKFYEISVIPKIISSTDTNGASITKAVYERTSNPSTMAQGAGTTADQFFHVQLSEKNDNPFMGDAKPHTEIFFKKTHPKIFRILKDMVEEVENGNAEKGTKLSDGTIVLTTTFPGKVVERKCPSYYGTTINKEGKIEKIQTRRKKINFTTGEISRQAEDMVVNTIKFFLFSNECESEHGEEIAYLRAMKSVQPFLVTAPEPNASASDVSNPAPDTTTQQQDQPAAQATDNAPA